MCAKLKMRANAPLLCVLVPMCAGFATAGLWANAADLSLRRLIFAATALLLIFLQLQISGKSAAIVKRFVKRATLFCGVFILGFIWFITTAPQNPYPDAPTLETALKIRIESSAVGQFANVYGLAKTVRAPQSMPLLHGTQIWYSTYSAKDSAQTPQPITRTAQIEAFGVLRPINPAESSFDAYLKLRGVHYKFSAFEGDFKEAAPPSAYADFFARLKCTVQKKLSAYPFDFMRDSPAAKAYSAMILGDKSLLSKEQKQNYVNTGNMHIFAVSGMHVAIVALVICAFLSFVGLPWRAALFTALPLVFIYVNICGAPPSAMRAFLMLCIAFAATLLTRSPKPLPILALAAFLSLLLDPVMIFDAGFMLSYCAVAGIVLYAIPISDFIKVKLTSQSLIPQADLNLWRRLKSHTFTWINTGLCIAYAAMLVTAPFTLYFFGLFTPATLLYSLVYVGGASFAVACGLGASVLPSVLAQYLNAAAWPALQLMDNGARLGANLTPAMGGELPSYAAALAAEFAILFFAWRGLKRGRLDAAFWIMPPLCVAALAIYAHICANPAV